MRAQTSNADAVRFDPETATLTYEISYERIQAVAQALECPPDVLENGLLHSALRHLFLFLPFEAGYYDGVKDLAVEVLSRGDGVRPVLSLRAPLDAVRDTNTPFRVYMNSFASPKAGYCFAVNEDTLELWLGTFRARGGRLDFDAQVLETDFRAMVADMPLATEPLDVEGETAASEAEAGAGGFAPLPYLSSEPVRVFADVQDVLEPATDYAAILETTQGSLSIDLFESLAPETTNNFVFLARHHFFEGLAFHRVLDDFMAQTGDPTGTGLGGPGYGFANEIVPGLSHSAPGVVSMANAGPGTNGSQFFITFGPAPYLDGQFSIFGVVTEGLEVLEALQRSDPDAPLTVATLDTSLGLLALQGVGLEGDDDQTLEAYLTERLGLLPEANQRVNLGEYDAVITSNPQTGGQVVAFWPASDRIISVQVVGKPK